MKQLKVSSIAELRTGIDMPTTTAALYESAAEAMLARAGKTAGSGHATTVSPRVRQLLQATFFAAPPRSSSVAAARLRAGLCILAPRRAASAALRAVQNPAAVRAGGPAKRCKTDPAKAAECAAVVNVERIPRLP